jgi:3-oxoacyl-[acyl-carrier protein] reductase
MITGGARGLGRGYALRFASLGADVAIIDRNLKAAEVYEFERQQMSAATVMEECEALGVRVVGLETDLTDRTATEKAVASVVDSLGRIDIAVCNAGGGTVTFADERDTENPEAEVDVVTTGTPSDCPQDMLERVLENNLMTCMYTCMAVAPFMKRQQSGKIVTVSSTAGVDAMGSYHPYGTAKAAIIHYIRTGRLGDRSHLAKHIPLRREGTIEDCVNVVEFLATHLSDYVTGRTILIDGGWSGL